MRFLTGVQLRINNINLFHAPSSILISPGHLLVISHLNKIENNGTHLIIYKQCVYILQLENIKYQID